MVAVGLLPPAALTRPWTQPKRSSMIAAASQQAVAIQDVAVDRLGVARVRPHALQQTLRRVQVTVEDDDVRADPRQRADDLAAQDAGPAGHDEGAAGKVIHAGELLQVHECSISRVIVIANAAAGTKR